MWLLQAVSQRRFHLESWFMSHSMDIFTRKHILVLTQYQPSGTFWFWMPHMISYTKIVSLYLSATKMMYCHTPIFRALMHRATSRWKNGRIERAGLPSTSSSTILSRSGLQRLLALRWSQKDDLGKKIWLEWGSNCCGEAHFEVKNELKVITLMNENEVC